MLTLSDEHHTVTSSTLSGPWKKKLVVQRSLFLWKVCGRFWCQKWSEVVWMDGRQSGVQKDRLGNFQWKNCSTELQLYTGFLRLLVASEVSEGGVWCVCAWELWRQVWLPNFGPFGVCQEDVLRSCKKEASDLCTGIKLKQSACPDMKLSDSFVTSVCTRTSSMLQKSHDILILVFIHFYFILFFYRETDGFMPQLPIVSIFGHLFWSTLSLVHWPLAQWAWPNLDLGLWHLLIPLPVCKY